MNANVLIWTLKTLKILIKILIKAKVNNLKGDLNIANKINGSTKQIYFLRKIHTY